MYKIGPRGDPFKTTTTFSQLLVINLLVMAIELSLQSESFNCVELQHES